MNPIAAAIYAALDVQWRAWGVRHVYLWDRRVRLRRSEVRITKGGR